MAVVQTLPCPVPGVHRSLVRDGRGLLVERVDLPAGRAVRVPRGGVFAAFRLDGLALDLGPPLAQRLADRSPGPIAALGLLMRVLRDLERVHGDGGAHGALSLEGWGFDARGVFQIRPSLHVPAHPGSPRTSDVVALGVVAASIAPPSSLTAVGLDRGELWLRGCGVGGSRVGFGDARAARQALQALTTGLPIEQGLAVWLEETTSTLPPDEELTFAPTPEDLVIEGRAHEQVRGRLDRELDRARADRWARERAIAEARLEQEKVVLAAQQRAAQQSRERAAREREAAFDASRDRQAAEAQRRRQLAEDRFRTMEERITDELAYESRVLRVRLPSTLMPALGEDDEAPAEWIGASEAKGADAARGVFQDEGGDAEDAGAEARVAESASVQARVADGASVEVGWGGAERDAVPAEADRSEIEGIEPERAEVEVERVRAARVEAERAASAEFERIEAERVQTERFEAERFEFERIEGGRAEIERIEAEQAQVERIEAERAQAERVEAARVEAERVEAERLEAERDALRVEAERLEAEREALRVEAERLEAERLEAERLEAERLEAEREALRVEAERLEAEREAVRVEAERFEAERLEAERLEAECLEAEREALRVAAERAAAVRAEAERVEAERAAAERAEAERAEAERVEAERAEAARVEARRVEAARADLQRAEFQRVEAQRVEAQRVEPQRVEPQRVEAQRVEPQRAGGDRAQLAEGQLAEESWIQLDPIEPEQIEVERADRQQAARAHADGERAAEGARLAEAARIAGQAAQGEPARVEAARIEAARVEAARIEADVVPLPVGPRWSGAAAVTGDRAREHEKGPGKWAASGRRGEELLAELPPRQVSFETDEGSAFEMSDRGPGPAWGGGVGITGSSAREREKGPGKWTESGRSAEELRAGLPAGPTRALDLEGAEPSGIGWRLALGAGVVLVLVGAVWWAL